MDLNFNVKEHTVMLSPRAYGDLEYKQRKNWNKKSHVKRERANLMFDRLHVALFTLANTTDFSKFSKSPKGTYQYTVTDGFAVIYFDLIKVNDSLVIYITDFLWPYKKDPNSWWAIVESNNKTTIKLTENNFANLITESVIEVLKEEFDYKKTSYEAKPKKKGGLNDWELFNIIDGIISKMIADKQISKDDGEMLMHYSLYNNDCSGGFKN